MAKRFYLDTSIWRDYFEDRRDNIRPLGELAARFLQECRAKGCKILYSRQTIKELGKAYSLEEINELLRPFEGLLVEASLSKAQYAEAKALALERTESHLADILHAIAARDYGAVLVARDYGFECLRDLVEVRKPEEITLD